MAERKLTERQKKFCWLCAAGVKPVEAAKMIGYQSYSQMAGKMLRMEKIQTEIARIKEKGLRRRKRKTDLRRQKRKRS